MPVACGTDGAEGVANSIRTESSSGFMAENLSRSGHREIGASGNQKGFTAKDAKYAKESFAADSADKR